MQNTPMTSELGGLAATNEAEKGIAVRRRDGITLNPKTQRTRADMRYFFVDPTQLAGARAVLEGSEASHLRNVIRLKRGDEVGLVDGIGFEYRAVIDRIVTGRVELEITARKMSAGKPLLPLTVAQAFLKEKKMDLVVRQLSELGVTRFVPFVCERVVARPEILRGSFRRERWHKIAVESLKQCRRGDVMSIEEVHRFDELLARGREHALALLFWENATAPMPVAAAGRPKPASVLAVLGPEGGFSEAEAQAAQAAGFHSVRLGPRILKAETAAVAACAIVQYQFGDLAAGQKPLDKE
jgi:16S rRNA (uracil1498-N3)-methyltransferase